ncbi:MAG: hypothetical protein NT074_07260 [Methanomicrobiales archaeon]|nr:hypothetical protein [Methanomicrobiales archaeon]
MPEDIDLEVVAAEEVNRRLVAVIYPEDQGFEGKDPGHPEHSDGIRGVHVLLPVCNREFLESVLEVFAARAVGQRVDRDIHTRRSMGEVKRDWAFGGIGDLVCLFKKRRDVFG